MIGEILFLGGFVAAAACLATPRHQVLGAVILLVLAFVLLYLDTSVWWAGATFLAFCLTGVMATRAQKPPEVT